MSNNEGIFQAVSGSQPASPFTPVEPGGGSPSPFMAVEKSPFAMVDDLASSRPVEPGKPAKLPDKRSKTESPFQLADDAGAVGFEPAAAAPFEPAAPTSPFALTGAGSLQPGFADPGYQASPPRGGWTQPAASAPIPAASPLASQFQAQPAASVFAPVSAAAAVTPPAPASVAAAASQPAPAALSDGDSVNIRQIELRAIFGVDREMSHEEIFQRVRSLPGIRHVARVDSQHVAAVDGLRQVLAGLGFGTGGFRIYCGASPVEFIREGNVVLAAQTDGGFAPGVRETLIIVARELAK